MKKIFKSQDLWDLVEFGYPKRDDDNCLKKNPKKDSKALFYIQQAVHEVSFPRISAITTSKQAWMILQLEFQGSSRVNAERLQTLR